MSRSCGMRGTAKPRSEQNCWSHCQTGRCRCDGRGPTISQARSARTELKSLQLEKELSEVKRQAERLVDQVADGALTGVAVKDCLDLLEIRRAELEGRLSAAPSPPVVALHPRMADHYRAVVASLERVLDRSDSEAVMEARDLVRRLIETVVVTPLPERGRFSLTVKGKIAALVTQDGENTMKLGAGAGFEPATFRL
jgi:site-specific DNA recombinase